MRKISELFNNQWTFLLIAFVAVFSLIIFNNCEPPENQYSKWRYEIRGKVIHKGKPHDAIWYTDTIEMGDNYCRYQNSDGTEVVIPAPYIIIDHKYDKVIEDKTPAF